LQHLNQIYTNIDYNITSYIHSLINAGLNVYALTKQTETKNKKVQ